MLFQDEELKAAPPARDPVAPAGPSAAAKHKKACGRTDDRLPLHSLGSMLAELGTRCRNRCRLKSDPGGPVLELPTEPTALQRRALDLVRAFGRSQWTTPRSLHVCFSHQEVMSIRLGGNFGLAH